MSDILNALLGSFPNGFIEKLILTLLGAAIAAWTATFFALHGFRTQNWWEMNVRKYQERKLDHSIRDLKVKN